MFQWNRSGKRARIEAPGFRVLAACRKPDDVERMNGLGFTGVLLDMDSPESVDHAADEVIALTGNRLYGLFNNAGYGVYGPLDTLSRETLEKQFSTNFSAYISSPCVCSPRCCRTVKGAS